MLPHKQWKSLIRCLPSPVWHVVCPRRGRAFLFVSKPEKLDEKQRHSIEQIRKAHPDLEMAYQYGQGFVMMLAEHRDADLDTWLIQAEHSGLPEFKKMAKGIRLDYVAVKAAFSEDGSQVSDGIVFVGSSDGNIYSFHL